MGIFQCHMFQSGIFQTDCNGSPAGNPRQSGVMAGGFSEAWAKHWAEEWARQEKRDYALERVRDSAEYRRLQRKLAMYQEQMDGASPSEQRLIDRKISEIKSRLRSLEYAVM